MTYYHGTRTPFRKKGLILPGSMVGKDNHPELKRNDRVYVTTDASLAWLYAYAAKGRGKPRVLVVNPLGPLSVDDSTVDGMEQPSYACDSATVVRVLEGGSDG